jgi:DNA-binding IclR family transcriptional regulator
VSQSSATAENVLDVLLLFDASRPELAAEEIGRLIGAPRSTTYRYIRTLRGKGFLEPTERDTFRLGPRLLQFARLAVRQEDVGRLALPFMEALSEKVHETILLTRLFNGHAVCVELVEAPRAVRISFERGQLQPLYTGASSKTLLAYVPEGKLEDYLTLPLQAFTPNTVTDLDELKTQLRQIRRQGYWLSEGEIDAGATTVTVPIIGRRRKLIAGLSVAGPTFRMDSAAVDRILTLLRDASAAIQEQLASADL